MPPRNSRNSKLTKRFDLSRSDFSPYGFTFELWTPTVMPRPDRHNEVEINLLPSGSLTYLLGGRQVTVRARRLTLFWAAVPHQILRWADLPQYYVATLPLDWFLACDFPDPFSNALLNGELISDAKQTDEDAQGFQRWIADLASPDARRHRVARMELEARLLRLALAPMGKSKGKKKVIGQTAKHRNLSKADQIACHIARHYHEPLTADQIAAAVGLHPNYAMTLFRSAFGTTIVDFLTQHRLTHAQRLLVTTDDAVVDIAFAAGFQSLSRFNEAFKTACGLPPRDYRRANHIDRQKSAT